MTTLTLTDEERDFLFDLVDNAFPDSAGSYAETVAAGILKQFKQQPLRPAEPITPENRKFDIPNVVNVQGQRCFTNHKHREWRPCTGVFGHVKGIDQLSGNAIASDGLLLLINQPGGQEAFVHLENFSARDQVFNKEPKTKPSVKRDRKPTKRELILAAMAEEYV